MQYDLGRHDIVLYSSVAELLSGHSGLDSSCHLLLSMSLTGLCSLLFLPQSSSKDVQVPKYGKIPASRYTERT